MIKMLYHVCDILLFVFLFDVYMSIAIPAICAFYYDNDKQQAQ